jgi:DNA (cytosine-5)-methyltransferase 1
MDLIADRTHIVPAQLGVLPLRPADERGFQTPAADGTGLMDEATVDSYSRSGQKLVRHLLRRDGTSVCSVVSNLAHDSENAQWSNDALYDFSWLRHATSPATPGSGSNVRVVDLFAGCGGLTLGVAEACRALAMTVDPLLAMDVDGDALRVYGENFPGAELQDVPVENIFSAVGTPTPSVAERSLMNRLGHVDVLIGGPPCQGHSDLNNHTRRLDPKNQLYSVMARFCELTRPTHVVIENVPGVVKDRSRVAQRTWQSLEELGYSVDSGVFHASAVGTAQHRRRSITLASLAFEPSVQQAEFDVTVAQRSLRWAIGDLHANPSSHPFGTPPRPSAENARRIDYLFQNEIHDLPDTERPDCHRLKDHSYVSMYGRLHWDRPAPTLTTGFGSMGRGRWVHPGERRTITPHEAARIQGFPDYFRFGDANRTLLHKLIGNAVPPKLGYALGVHLLR